MISCRQLGEICRRGYGTKLVPNGVGINVDGGNMLREVVSSASRDSNGRYCTMVLLGTSSVGVTCRAASPVALMPLEVFAVVSTGKDVAISRPSAVLRGSFPYTQDAFLPAHREQGFLKSHFTFATRHDRQALGRPVRLPSAARRRQYCTWRAREASERSQLRCRRIGIERCYRP
jgi:hypothetical protein